VFLSCVLVSPGYRYKTYIKGFSPFVFIEHSVDATVVTLVPRYTNLRSDHVFSKQLTSRESRISNTPSAQGLARFARFNNALLCAFAELRQQRVGSRESRGNFADLRGSHGRSASKQGVFPEDRPAGEKKNGCLLFIKPWKLVALCFLRRITIPWKASLMSGGQNS